jgi:hypothetical protein
VTNRAIAHARLRNSRLVRPALADPQSVVGWFGAVQAQDVPGALWAIAQRLPADADPSLEAIGAAMDDGRVVRVHALRPTWHFLVPSELRWIQTLTGPRVHQVNGTMYRRLGLGPAEFARADAAIREALAGGRAVTRPELAAAIASTGIDLADSLVITYIAMHAELDALIVNGPRRGKEATYQLASERIAPAPPLSPADSLRELTIRYFTSHGPALAHDMAWWSGLTVGAVREGIALAGAALESRRVDGREYWSGAGRFDPEPGLVPDDQVLLLPNYDEALASYTDYGPVLDESLPRARNVSDVLGAHLVVRAGLVVGGWRRTLGRDRVTVTATLLRPFSASELDGLAAQADRFGRFLGLPAVVEVREG